METTPSAAELIEAAVETIRAELLPELSGRAAFQARVAINVLETARRELRGAPAADAAEHSRLRALLGRDGDLPTLRSALCDAIRDGRADLATPGLADHLWADVLARVAIDQPSYPSFVREAAPSTRTRA